MRKLDYQKLKELCSVERATAPFTFYNLIPPENLGSIKLSYLPNPILGLNLLSKIESEWNNKVKEAEKEGKKMFSKPMMGYIGHSVSFVDEQKAQVTINLGESSYAEHILTDKIDSSKASWGFGSNSFMILEDDESQKYILFGDRNKILAHTNQPIERELFPQGFFYTGALEDQFNGDTALDTLVRKQLSEQTNFSEGIIKNATIETIGFFALPHPHFVAPVSHAINLKLPCKAKDFGQFHKGEKYTSSTLVKFEDITNFVENQGDNLVPISRLLLWQYALRHPELAE